MTARPAAGRNLKRVGLFVLVILAVLLMAAFGHYSLARQRLQLKADAAAEAAANGIAQGQDGGAAARRRLNSFPPAAVPEQVVIEWPPRQGRFRGRRAMVRAVIRSEWRPPLVAARFSMKMEARATVVALRAPAPRVRPTVLRVE